MLKRPTLLSAAVGLALVLGVMTAMGAPGGPLNDTSGGSLSQGEGEEPADAQVELELVGDVIDCPVGEDPRFKFEQEGAEFEVTGLLVSLDSAAVMVTGPAGDVTASVDATTEIEGSPQPGDPVKAEGAVLEDGSFLAREVKSACEDEEEEAEAADEEDEEELEVRGAVIDCPEGDDPRFEFEQEGSEFEVTGLLVSLDSAAVTVTGPLGDVTVSVDDDTEIEDEPQPGDPVEVEGAVLGDGSFLAREVEPACEAPDGEDEADDDDGALEEEHADDVDDHDGDEEDGDHGDGHNDDGDDDHSGDDDHGHEGEHEED